MKKQIDNFLLGTLWILAVILGATFWFNTRFAFNLFDGEHWRYLGGLQAANTPITYGFYISMIVAVVVMLGGLYLIVRPKFRKIKLAPPAPPKEQDAQHSTLNTGHSPARPPRLMSANTPPPSPPPALLPTPIPVVEQNFDEVNKIFTDAGYLVKTPPTVAGLKPALFAIGPGEVLWIGVIGDKVVRLVAAVEKLRTIFMDTLEDVPIEIHPFIVDAKKPVHQADVHIQEFDTIENLREFITNNPAPDMNSDEQENFTAYSEYIDTVSGYLNKL